MDIRRRALFLSFFLFVSAVKAQTSSTSTQTTPLYSIKIEPGTTKVISYRNLNGATKIDFRGTPLAPQAKGRATIRSGDGTLDIDANVHGLEPANKFGVPYLTYVLWSISPEGRATNLGEVILKGNKGRLHAITQLQAFGLIVTAEPYYAVTQVGNVVVLENAVRKNAKGQVEQLEAKFELMPREQYVLTKNPADLKPMQLEKKIPFEVYQARNAVQIAREAGADTIAPESYRKAEQLLTLAEDNLIKDKDRKMVPSIAREAIQTAEDARLIALKRSADQTIATQLSKADAAVQKAEAQRILAATEAEIARSEVEKANALAAKSQEEKVKLREELRAELGQIFPTTDTARGLVVSLPNFTAPKTEGQLGPLLREQLINISDVALDNPGVKLNVEEYNSQFSAARADAVRTFFISQGVPERYVTSTAASDLPQPGVQVQIVVNGSPIDTAPPSIE